ncbi:gliding motility-associated C-terminal domain-containing protein [Hymenobacter koreensis]
MQTALRIAYRLFFSCLFMAILALQARASHVQGGQLTYRWVSGTTYEVTLVTYRDCSGIGAETSFTLAARSGGCASTATTATLIQTGVPLLGTPYCPGIQAQVICPDNSGTVPFTNFKEYTYIGRINLPPADEWVLSVESCCRPETRTLAGGVSAGFRFEATLNNRITPAGGTVQTIENTSPRFAANQAGIRFECAQKNATVTFSANDPVDNDSLVYELAPPLDGCNTPNSFLSYPTNLRCTTRTVAGCTYTCSGTTPASFSPTFPIAVSFDTTGTCPNRTLTPRFRFSPADGLFSFTAASFVPGNTTAAQAQNKYVVVGKVTEYRRFPGSNRRYKVGSIRRDMLVVIIDCGTNSPPDPPQVVVSTQQTNAVVRTTRDSTYITVQACNYARVRLRFTDPNTSNLLTVEPFNNPSNVLEGGDIGEYLGVSANGSAQPQATLLFQPQPNFVGTTRTLLFRITDDGCPFKGTQVRPVVIRVVEGEFARALASTNQQNQAVVCEGQPVTINALVQRPDSVIRNRQVYAFTWSGSRTGITPAEGLNPGDANLQNITVRPTRTTRYYLTITPTRAFQPALCRDTASILVRILPRLTASFTVAERAFYANRDNIPPRIFTFTNTTPSLAPNDSVRWTYKRITNDAGEQVMEDEIVFSRQRIGNPELTLDQGGQYEIRLFVFNNVAGTSCPSAVALKTVQVPPLVIPNVITPNGDGKNETLVLQSLPDNNQVQIFNRWGRLVREYKNYQNDWDAKDQPDGIYYFMVTAQNGQRLKGWVEIIR